MKKVHIPSHKIQYTSFWRHLDTIISKGSVLGVGFVPITITSRTTKTYTSGYWMQDNFDFLRASYMAGNIVSLSNTGVL